MDRQSERSPACRQSLDASPRFRALQGPTPDRRRIAGWSSQAPDAGDRWAESSYPPADRIPRSWTRPETDGRSPDTAPDDRPARAGRRWAAPAPAGTEAPSE